MGKNSEAGNNLIMDKIHESGGGVPARTAPLILMTTVITHLFAVLEAKEERRFKIKSLLFAYLVSTRSRELSETA